MKPNSLCLSLFVVALFFVSTGTTIAAGTGEEVTQNECALTKDAEIIWDLNKRLWVCCVPAGDGLEKCIPITDMKPLPKTSLKPLPSNRSKSITIPHDNSKNNKDGGS